MITRNFRNMMSTTLIILMLFLNFAPLINFSSTPKAKAADDSAKLVPLLAICPTIDKNGYTIAFSNDGKTVKVTKGSDNKTYNFREVVKFQRTITITTPATMSSPATTTTTTSDAYDRFNFENSATSESLSIFTGLQGTYVDLSISFIKLYGSGSFSSAFNTAFPGDPSTDSGNNIIGVCTNAGAYNGSFDSKIDFHGENAPTIEIGAKGTERPKTIFKLTYSFNKGDSAIDEDIYMFSYLKNEDGTTDIKYKNYYIKLLNTNRQSWIDQCGDITNYQTCTDNNTQVVRLNADSVTLFWNHVYNNKPAAGASTTCGTVTTFSSANSDPTLDKDLSTYTGTENPPLQCQNGTDAGWLAKWGAKPIAVSFPNPTGATGADCGYALTVGDAIKVAMCNLTMMVREWAFSLMCFAQDKLLLVISDAPITGATGCDANPVLLEHKQKSMDNFN